MDDIRLQGYALKQYSTYSTEKVDNWLNKIEQELMD
jgi:hypothetical protein